MEKITKQQLNEAIDRVELRAIVDSKIGQNDNEWVKDFMIGVKCGIAAQKMVR